MKKTLLNHIFTLAFLVILISLLFVGCKSNGVAEETTLSEKDSSTTSVDSVDYTDEVFDALSTYLEDSESPLWKIIQLCETGAQMGYSVDITETEDAIDSKAFTTHSIISSDPNVGMKMNISASYDNSDPISFEVFAGTDELVFSNNELFGDNVYGFKYNEIYENIDDTVFDPDGTFGMRYTSYGLKGYIHPMIAQIGENNISEQYKVYNEISKAFFENALSEKKNGKVLAKETSVFGKVISFELKGDNYKNFYYDLADICMDNNLVRNYVVNTCDEYSNTVIDSFKYDNIAVNGYEDYIRYLRQKGDSGKDNGSVISLSFCIDGDELAGVSLKNDDKSYPYEYTFVKTETDDVAYYIFTTDKDPNRKDVTYEEFGVASVINTDDTYSIKYTYDIVAMWNSSFYFEFTDKEGYFDWNKNSGEYTLCYFYRGYDQIREGKLFIEDNGFEFESYCRKYNNNSLVKNSDGEYEFIHTSILTELNDSKIVFSVGTQTVNIPEYTNVMLLSKEEAEPFIENVINNYINAFYKDSWANFWACYDRDTMIRYQLDKVDDSSDELVKLNICAKLVYTGLFGCFRSYRNVSQEDSIKLIVENCQMIETGTYYCLRDDIYYIYEYGAEEKDTLKNQGYYLITFEDYKATVEYVGY